MQATVFYYNAIAVFVPLTMGITADLLHQETAGNGLVE